MDPHELETTATDQVPQQRRRRWAWITIAAVGIASAVALLAVPAIAEAGDSTKPSDASNDRVVVCDTGVETYGDIQISASNATRIADSDTSPTPEGCREE